ncbi:MAG: hypothetical protein C4586_08325 [Anaerolineaceae bacterium]|nr:MAG: hypothetical protein C4586_08325 [Anaerolineaceae bacterium]
MKKFILKHKFALAFVAVVAVMASFGALTPALAFGLFGVTTTDLTDSQTGYPANAIGKTTRIRKRITIPLALQVASDIVKILNVKAGWLVKQVHIIMVTPTTGDALTANIGDGDGASSFDAAMSLKGAAGTRTYGIDGTDAYITSGGKYYAADDTIDLAFVTVTNPAGAVVIDVIAEIVDFND